MSQHLVFYPSGLVTILSQVVVEFLVGKADVAENFSPGTTVSLYNSKNTLLSISIYLLYCLQYLKNMLG